MTTTIGTWGNSAAIRIPRAILKLVSLGQGGRVDVRVNERGNIEISSASVSHRRVAPAQGITFDSLFAGYEGGRHDSSDAWPEGSMEGAGARVGQLDDVTMAAILARAKVVLGLDRGHLGDGE